MHRNTPGFPVLHSLLEFAQTRVHRVSDALQPSHPLFPHYASCLQCFPASGSFPVSRLFTFGGQCIGASVLPMNIQGPFPLELTGLVSLLSKGLLESSPATIDTCSKHQYFGAQPPLWSSSHMYT